MPGEPILGKNAPTAWDHRPMNWRVFLVLRKWAKRAAERTALPVYLVGSVLTKDKPRDVDVAFVMSSKQMETLFGPVPEPGSDERRDYQTELHKWISGEVLNAMEALVDEVPVDERVTLDIKLTSDAWWSSKDRLLLARPF